MPRFAVVVLVLCTSVCAAAPAYAQYFGRNKVHYESLQFRVLKTEHFDIYYYDAEAEATKQAGRMAERWYSRYSQLFEHSFTRRQPIVLYESRSHFAQTNLSAATPGEGVGGFTEQTRSRIAMPFTAGLGETDHILGHEIAHAFQIDIARRAKQNAFGLPAWVIEGMAEYLSVGPLNTFTSMWLSDAAQHHRLPTIEQLNDPRYFPYRYGHAVWAYLTATYGDEILGRMLRSKTTNVVARLEQVTGHSRSELTKGWHASIHEERRGDGELPEGRVMVSDGPAARLQVGPALSPDGTRLMFLSERDRISLDLFLANTRSGLITRKIVSTVGDAHFDSLQYINSAGAWDPTGRRFAFGALGNGAAVLTIVDADDVHQLQEFPLYGVGEIYSPSWSPDGTRLVFSALKGGLSDLFIFTPSTHMLRRLTADGFADLQPAWSPDGRSIAFASDRFTTTLDDLSFGPLNLVLLDLASGTMRRVTGGDSTSKQINPQWAPDGSGIYFVGDRGGISNVYLLDLASSRLRQMTDVQGGVSGITATSPAIAVASQSGALAFSVFTNGRYEIRSLSGEQAMLGRVVSPDDAPSHASVGGTLVGLLRNVHGGLPDGSGFRSEPYDNQLRLESVIQPYVGASTSSFGGLLQGGFGLTFGDTLRDRQLQTLIRLSNDPDNLAAQFGFANRRSQWNWGVTGGFAPSLFSGARRALERTGDLLARETSHLRYTQSWAHATARFNIDRTRRFEFGVGVRRTGLEWQTITRVDNLVDRTSVSRTQSELPGGPALYLGEAQAAFVHDTAVFGATSPISGQRYRVELQPGFGGSNYVDVRADVRKYFMPVRPLTVAARVEHTGRYGSTDWRLTPIVSGLQTLVRGYNLNAFAADSCGAGATKCSVVDQVRGGRLALVNLELRAPLFGLLHRDLQYGPLPIEAIAFFDAGFLWTHPDGFLTPQRARFRSVGAGGRINAGGIVLELTAARPFDRNGMGWTTSLLIRPGF